MYEKISQGLHKNIEFKAFFTPSGIISTLAKSSHTLIEINVKIPIPNKFHNNNVQKINKTHNKIDSFSHRYGIL
jgi:hypothetical protein